MIFILCCANGDVPGLEFHLGGVPGLEFHLGVGLFCLHFKLLKDFQVRAEGDLGPGIPGDGFLYTREHSALSPLCALYATASILQVLAKNT